MNCYFFKSSLLCCLSFFIFLKLSQVIFSSLNWSSCLSLRSRQCDGKSQIPLGGLSGPSVRASGSDSQSFSPAQLLLCLDPSVCCCVSAFSRQLLSRFCVSAQSNLLIRLLGLVCIFHLDLHCSYFHTSLGSAELFFVFLSWSVQATYF